MHGCWRRSTAPTWRAPDASTRTARPSSSPAGRSASAAATPARRRSSTTARSSRTWAARARSWTARSPRSDGVVPAKSPPTYEELVARMQPLHAGLRRRKLTVAAAESCTGGLLASVLSAYGGSSEYFKGGAVVYSNESKTALADVAPDLIHGHGAVSSVVAGAPPPGARERLRAQIALRGAREAGPGRPTPREPRGPSVRPDANQSP